jgi:hypothetical protein
MAFDWTTVVVLVGFVCVLAQMQSWRIELAQKPAQRIALLGRHANIGLVQELEHQKPASRRAFGSIQ